MANTTLATAKLNKQDEFYTQLVDIENELKHYKEQLRDKVIFCNCDDPYESNFFKYFANNFNALRIKKLIATSYVKSPIIGGQLPLLNIEGLKPEGREPIKIEINEVPDLNNDGAISLDDVKYLLEHDKNVVTTLKGDTKYNAGDFRSKECIELLKQADVVITNPPFSLFREFISLLIEHNKHFLIIGNINAITYKEVFKLIKGGRLWLGNSHRNKGLGLFFDIPESVNTDFATRMKDGKIFIGGAAWFTTLDTPKNHEPMTLYKKYYNNPSLYPKYANFDAIEVSRTKDIPCDYDGLMGVPITFLNSGYNPDQFEIIGSSRELSEPMSKIAEKGTYVQGGPRFYLHDGKNKFRRIYDRLIIKRKGTK